MAAALCIGIAGINALRAADSPEQDGKPGVSANALASKNDNVSAAEVSVFFKGKLVLSLAEIRERAIIELRKRNYVLGDGYHCEINLSLSGGDKSCVVLFTKKLGQPAYQVIFDDEGMVQNIMYFIAREGPVQQPEDMKK